MKKMLMGMMTLALLSGTAFAHGGGDHGSTDKLVDTAEAVKAALSTYEDSTESAEDLFKGVKAAPFSKGVSVKVYLNNGSKIAYKCHRHEDHDPFECHEAE